jgi:hypothetical protein
MRENDRQSVLNVDHRCVVSESDLLRSSFTIIVVSFVPDPIGYGTC